MPRNTVTISNRINNQSKINKNGNFCGIFQIIPAIPKHSLSNIIDNN